MNLTDILTTSYHYFYRIYLKATEENWNFDILEFKGLNAHDSQNLTL